MKVPPAKVLLGAALPLLLSGPHTAAQPNSATPQSVLTYHYDNLRIGWNSNETVLTPVNVHKTTFGIQHTVTLDEQADGQPLVVPHVRITAVNATPSKGTLPVLFQEAAGTWPNVRGNANLVPVVADGHVYVASHKQLRIFGLIAPGATRRGRP